jgi:hypothetical protein
MAFKKSLVGLDFGGVSKITGLATPTLGSDAVNKTYADTLIEGLNWKEAARVATNTDVTLSAPGTTIDGVTMVNGDRFLVFGQTAPEENGIYVFASDATPAIRATDANSASELNNAVLTISAGTNAGKAYRSSVLVTTLESDPVTFVLFGSVTVADATDTVKGIIELATQAEVDAGTDTVRAVTPATLKSASFLLKKYTETIGDGVSTTISVTHNLNTQDITASVYITSSYEQVLAAMTATSANVADFVFDVAPTSNELTVVIIG